MKTTYSAKFMQENCGCYKEENGKLESMVLKGRKEITYQDILDCGIPLKDKYWFFCKKVFTKEQNQQIAIEIAECVLPIYEKKYPNNKALRQAIEAAKLYLTGHITLEELLKVRYTAADAANAAYAYAADAANAAYAAADAAYAAADAYANAADAADAAYAAYAAADANKTKLTELLAEFIIKENANKDI